MSSSHYDVVVLGVDLAPLTCAALLAKRGFRVLVLGQGTAPASYRLGAFRLPRRPCMFTAHTTPIAERVLAELGLHPSVRRATRALDPAFQVALPNHRVDMPRDAALLEREIEREFARVKRPALDFFARVDDLSAVVDALFARDAAWPPESLWERRRAARASAHVPFERNTTGPDILSEFPEDHPFRAVALAPYMFAADADTWPAPALGLARLLASAQRTLGLDGGHAVLADFLRERIAAHGGSVRLDERAQAVVVRRGTAVAIVLAGSGEEVAAEFIVAGTDVDALLRLVPDRHPFEELYDRYGEPRIRLYRYALNVVLPVGVLPEAMGTNVFRLGAMRGADARVSGSPDDAYHLQRTSLDARTELVTIEALLPSGRVESEDGYLDGSRARLLDVLEDVAPFARDRVLVADSPHDGLLPDAHDATVDASLDVTERRGPHTMQAVHAFPVMSQHGLCALPPRTPIRRLLLCNTQVMPALGMEGQWLAAASVARIVTHADRTRAWMRRRTWSRVRI